MLVVQDRQQVLCCSTSDAARTRLAADLEGVHLPLLHIAALVEPRTQLH